MKIYLNPDGTWKVESEIEGIDKYEDLPEVVKRILHLAVVMLPYGEMYLSSEEDEVAKKIGEVVGFDFSVGRLCIFTYETYGSSPSTTYYIYIDNDTIIRERENQHEPT